MTTFVTTGDTADGNEVKWETIYLPDFGYVDDTFHDAVHKAAREQFERMGYTNVKTVLSQDRFEIVAA